MSNQLANLLLAAQAVVARWDTPAWKDAPHTGEFIHALRQALAAHEAAKPASILTQDEIDGLYAKHGGDGGPTAICEQFAPALIRAVLAAPAPEAAKPAEPPHNPWRESLENCITGDNYLRASEYRELIDELDGLYTLLAAPVAVASPLSNEQIVEGWRTTEAERGEFGWSSSMWFSVGVRFAELSHGVKEKP